MRAKELNRENYQHYRDRLSEITPDTSPRWGSMNPAMLMAHLSRTVEISLGEHPVEDISNVFTRNRLVHKIFLETLPWPKGKIKAPDYFMPAEAGEFQAEREQLLAKMEEFVATAENEPERVQPSPIFGPLTLLYWTKLHGLHFEHHCRQFGV